MPRTLGSKPRKKKLAKLPTLRPKSKELLKFEKDVLNKMSDKEYMNMSPKIEEKWELLRLPRLGKVYDDNPRRPGESVKAYSNRLFLLDK
tara:strand:- start:300 stop:569 length:270 start_codon:yes stop_codon:yes gene_type:complete